MSFFEMRRAGAGETGLPAGVAHVHERRAVRSDRICGGTLACARCDAPVSTGGMPLALSDPLVCPFCAHHGPVRDFLSLAPPTRPARVDVRLRPR